MKTTHWFIACFALATFILPQNIAAAMQAPVEDANVAETDAPEEEIVSVTDDPRFGKITVRRLTFSSGNNKGLMDEDDNDDWDTMDEDEDWDTMDDDGEENELDYFEFTTIELADGILKEIEAFIREQFLKSEKLLGMKPGVSKGRPMEDYRLDKATRKTLAENFQLPASAITEATLFEEGSGMGTTPSLMFHNERMEFMVLRHSEPNFRTTFLITLDDEIFTPPGYDKLTLEGHLDKKFEKALEAFEATCTDDKIVPPKKPDEGENGN